MSRSKCCDINILKRAVGLIEHHDAVTGTEKQNVAEDYAQRLSEGSKAAQSFMGPSLFNRYCPLQWSLLFKVAQALVRSLFRISFLLLSAVVRNIVSNQ